MKNYTDVDKFGAPATQNANGTINWRALYGEEAFRLNPPLYESELQKIRASAGPDLKSIEQQAKEFAEVPFLLICPLADTASRALKAQHTCSTVFALLFL